MRKTQRGRAALRARSFVAGPAEWNCGARKGEGLIPRAAPGLYMPGVPQCDAPPAMDPPAPFAAM